MPYRSQAQWAYLHAQHPEVAAKWDAEGMRRPRRKRVSKAASTLSGMNILLGGATLSELGEISKSRDPREPMDEKEQSLRRRRSGYAQLAGAGGTAAGLGTFASGIPGLKPKPGKPKIKDRLAGEFNWRDVGHAENQRQLAERAHNQKMNNGKRIDDFQFARRGGQSAAEVPMVRELKRGAKVGRAGQVAGLGMLGVGAAGMAANSRKLRRQGYAQDPSQDPKDKRSVRSGAGLMGGAAMGGTGYWARRKGKKWNATADRKLGEAEALTPGLQRESGLKTGQVMNRNTNVAWNPLERASRRNTVKSGAAHGYAKQARYFGNTYKKMGIGLMAAGAAAAAAPAMSGAGWAGDKMKQRDRVAGANYLDAQKKKRR